MICPLRSANTKSARLSKRFRAAGTNGRLDLSLAQWFDSGVDKPLKDLVGDTEQIYWWIIFWVPHGLHWLWDRHYKRSSPDLGNFESAQIGRKKVSNQGFKAAPAWTISSGQMESGPRALSGFKCWREAVNVSLKKCQRYLLGLILWLSKGQRLLERQVEKTCCQQPRISHF